MVDLRSHRSRPYEYSPVQRRTRLSGSTTPIAPTSPISNNDQATAPIRSPLRARLRSFRATTAHKDYQQDQQQQQQPCQGQFEFIMDSLAVSAPEHREKDHNQDHGMLTAGVDVNADVEMVQGPAIFRLSPELLALIFYYVYVTPVVHRPSTTTPAKNEQNTAPEELSSSRSSSPTSPPLSSSSSESATTEGFAGRETSTTMTRNTAPNTTSMVTTTSDPSFRDTSGVRRKKDKRKSAVYIQNDLSSMLALCLTCRAFYPQAIRMLWRQRTLADYDDLTEFYQAIDFSASLRRRQQKQRQQEQQRQRPGMGYAVEEGLFNNEAALRIKSLTLLDMSLGSTLPMTANANATSALASGQFFGSSSSHGDPLAAAAGTSLDLCQGLDMLTRTNVAADESAILAAAYSKDATPLSSSPSSSSSSMSLSGSPVQSRRRPRQKTTSIYSQMISPRLLNTIAHHCYALVDLTICMDNKSSTFFHAHGPKLQASIPFSIIAGALLSLKRLTLMGLVCDPKQNKTGSELLIFAQNIQPLERISIRSCQGITVRTYIELAMRSHRHLLSVDFQGLDFESSQQLTDMMSAYAHHCKNMKSITLSCLNGLALDGMFEVLASHGAPELQELHVLGHDSFRFSTQQQGQQQQEPAAAPVPPQQQAPQPDQNNNDNNDNNNQDGAHVPMTQMCHLADANVALSNLAQLPLRRLTMYCPGITDFALFQYLLRSPKLVDLVLNEPTTILQHSQFQAFVNHHLPAHQGTSALESSDDTFGPVVTGEELTEVIPFTSAGFMKLIFARCPWLKYMFMKLTLETAQEWIVQPCFKEARLDKCLYQYRTATGAPAVVLMWDARNKVVIGGTKV
ncbi:hypothetical protein BC939DRAFT_445627 [Gamsiella multidivaricata]|uniref:uncharacterized protein n=1 Tax=Gamsiella multidivaricata TaxID=101098 RepID=UPI00221E6F44|nr:uncharacterized protein BC939DRAFT_445627 [Gamsiella multidivaricata]KAI7827044.1 hypothetical protein BC939DRAFT_445627 [Gamsiella multidivaricata]